MEVLFKDTNGESYVETTTKVSSNDAANTITLIDLCDTRISAYETGSNNLTLSFSQLKMNSLSVCLSVKRFTIFDAVKFLNELGARLGGPCTSTYLE